jgi:hypothetical protein
MEYNAAEILPTFPRNMSPATSGMKAKASGSSDKLVECLSTRYHTSAREIVTRAVTLGCPRPPVAPQDAHRCESGAPAAQVPD